MKNTLKLILSLLIIIPILSHAQENKVASKAVNIYSDGTRLSGDVFYPNTYKEGEKLPAIVLCTGWGGNKGNLNKSYAPAFAAAGFVVLTFDYRGWGESDSRLVIEGAMPTPDENGMITVKAKAIRELVDPIDQLEDIQSALDYLEGEPMVDKNRIGLWGTSNGGGLAIHTTANDSRIKAVVSQVGSMTGNWVNLYYPNIHERKIKRARGEMDPVPQGVDQLGQLKGTPYLERIANYSPLNEVDKLKVPTLLMDAENEHLFKINEHSGKVYELIKDRVVSEYIIISGIKHYGIYKEAFPKSLEMGTDWFLKHL